jgi:PAS domain S-box-containing protein
VSHASSARPPDSVALRRDELILALQARERFLDGILGSLEVFMTVDEDWRLTYVNKAAAAMIDSSPEELLGRDLRELGDPDAHPGAWEVMRRAMDMHADAEHEEAEIGGRTYHGKVYALAEGGLAVYVRDVTEAKRRQLERDELFTALELSEQSFAAVFESSPFAMSLTEMPAARITRVNRAFEDLFGFKREELVGSTSPDLGISDPASQAEVARRFAADGVVREFEVSRTTHGGERRTLSLSLDWVTIGQRKHVLTSIRDVTKRAQAEDAVRASEAALRASEERYRTIVETTGDGIMIGDPDGIITFANRRMADMLGYGPDELIGLHGFDLIFPGWEPAVLDNRAALDQGEVVRGEFKLRRKDGTPIWTVFSSTPMLDHEGRHVGNLTMHSDITELKAAEEALRSSDERFRLVLSAAPVTVAAQDEDLRFVWAFNQRTAPADDVIGKTDADIFTAEEADHLRALKRRVIDEGVELHEQLWFDRPPGRVFLDCTFSPLRDETGKVTGVGVTTVDLTQMRLAEEALRESELAAAAREERSRLARDLHDSITQALFAASLKAEALTTAGGASPEIDELAQEVRRLTGGALAQMRTMLLELRGEPLDSIPLMQLLRNVVEATESRTRTKIDLTVKGSQTVPADLHAALYRITQEALNNVVRHARAENAWIVLSLEPSAVRLAVGDDGCGFDLSPVGPTHLGLRSMRERASEVGADFRVVTAPGSGTEIVLEWRPPTR